MKNRIGLLGGTFNPIHRGHVRLGLEVLEAFKLDKIFYILSANPPHKKNTDIAPALLRWKMLNKALNPFPALIACDIEMKRATYSWTWQTVKELKRFYPDSIFYFISGSEGFLKIRTWRNYVYLLEKLPFIVVFRTDGDIKKVKALLENEGIKARNWDEEANQCPCVHLFSYTAEELSISSTMIRNNVKLSKANDKLVNREVKKIMEENRLYER